MTTDLAVKEWMELTPVGVKVVRAPTFEEWQGETETWIALRAKSPEIIGDLLNYGEMMWKEKWAQVIDPFSQAYKPQTLMNYKSVMNRVPQAVRNPGNVYNHYDAVAKLPQDAQAKILKLAAEERWNTDEVRDYVKAWERENGMAELPSRFKMDAILTEEVRGDKLFYLLEPLTVEGDVAVGMVSLSGRKVISSSASSPCASSSR